MARHDSEFTDKQGVKIEPLLPQARHVGRPETATLQTTMVTERTVAWPSSFR